MGLAMPSAGLRSLHDIEAFEQVPIEQRNIPASSYEALKEGAAIDPDAPAISFFADASHIDSPTVFSHREFIANVHRTANALRRLGVERDEVVAYVLPNLPETHFVIWGGSAAGQVLAINPMLEAVQISDLLRAARVRVVVTVDEAASPDIWTKVSQAARGQVFLRHILMCDTDRYRGSGGLEKRSESLSPEFSYLRSAGLAVSPFWDELRGERSDSLDFPPPTGSDLSTLLCTGGTTGSPKIAKRTHSAEAFTCWATAQFNPDLYASRRTSFCGLPLFHSNAIMVSGLLPLMYGGHVVLGGLGGYRSEGILANFWKIAEHFQVAVFSGVPAIYDALLQIPRQDESLSSLVCGVCGAAPMPRELFRTFEKTTGVRIIEGYGLTEGTVISSRNPLFTDEPQIGSIGLRLPYQRMRSAIIDEAGAFLRWAEIDEGGEICISGPNLFDGYLIEDQNRGVWFDQDGRHWFLTGDLARQDRAGYFWMTGRKKELIIRGGHNIDPAMIEEAMQAHPQVSMAAAVGRPDAAVGEVPVLYFQSCDGDDVDLDDIARFARVHVPERAAIPKDFIRLDSLPLTAVGKINKLALNMLEVERIVRLEAERAGADINDLTVAIDPRRGAVATISIRSGLESFSQALGGYAITVDMKDAGGCGAIQSSSISATG